MSTKNEINKTSEMESIETPEMIPESAPGGALGSKGVDLYTFSTEGFYTKGVKTVYESSGPLGLKSKEVEYPKLYPENYKYNKDHYEMEASVIFDNDKLRLEIYKGNACVGRVSIQVSGQTGKISENEIMQFLQPSVVTNDFCFSCGLYYSDSGNITNLPNAHQFYGVVTENQSNWMGRLFKSIGNKYNTIKLSDLILPGSHDAGMYLEQPLYQFAAFANTQKDSISDQLAMGSRIFDFRPGRLTSGWISRLVKSKAKLPTVIQTMIKFSAEKSLELIFKGFEDKVRHLHAFVPGETYENTVSQITHFLEQNKQEIVIIYAVSDGILFTEEYGQAVELVKQQELESIVDNVIKQSRSSIKIGSVDQLKEPVANLIAWNQRLIILYDDKVRMSGNSTVSTKSYDEKRYESSTPNNVMSAITELNDKQWGGVDLIDMSLQLTATATEGGQNRVAFSLSYQAVSPLFATKAATDMLTYPWIHAGNIKKMGNSPMVTVYNDFYDPGLTAAVIVANKKRLDVK